MEAPEPSVPGYAPAEPPVPPPAPRLPAMGAEARAVARAMGIRRNDPCPCGSGKKFKVCHLGREQELIALMSKKPVTAVKGIDAKVIRGKQK
jgi:hypothetical protein